MSTYTKTQLRFIRRRNRSKQRPNSNISKPRLVVFRSARHIYGQIVDDIKATTLVSCSTLDKGIQDQLKGVKSKVEASELVGKELAVRALDKKIDSIVFDRNGFIYHGRIKAFADGVRAGGLKF